MMNYLGGACRALVVLAFAAGLALPAAAQTFTATPDTVMAALEDAGFDAELAEAEDGFGPMINVYSAVVDASFEVRFEACDDDGTDCELIVFAAGFSFDDASAAASLEKINDWNVDHWGKALLNDAKAMWVSFEVNARYGLTEENFADTITWFENTMVDFVDYIGWEPA